MEINCEKRDGILYLCLHGRLDSATAAEMEDRLLSLVSGERQVVVDLAGVEYASVSALRALLRVAKRVASADGKLVAHSLSHQVRQVCDITGMAMVLRLFDSREEAMVGVGNTGLLPASLLRSVARV